MIALPFPYSVIGGSEYAIKHKNNDEQFAIRRLAGDRRIRSTRAWYRRVRRAASDRPQQLAGFPAIA